MRLAENVDRAARDTPVLVPCPACRRPFPWPPTGRCERCAADLTGPVAATIFDIDREAAALVRRRAAAVADLRADAAADGRAALPRDGSRTPAQPRRSSSVRPQVFLAGAGAVLLLAAAVVFIAVTWPTWPPAAQAGFVTLLTAVGAVGARAAAGRGLLVTADALGVVTIAIAAYRLLAARREGFLGLDAVDPLLWFALVAAGAAVVSRPFATWAGLRAAVRRLGAVAAIAAGGAGLAALVRLVDTVAPAVLLVGAAPAVAVALLHHARWVLSDGDPFRHATRVTPLLLAAAAAVASGLLPLDAASLVAVPAGAAVGLPVLVQLRRTRPADPWSGVGAVVAVVWVVQLATFLLTDATLELAGLARPRLVTVSVVAVVIAAAARWRPPAVAWRLPVLVATSMALLPAVVWTLAVWAERSGLLVAVLESPFTGWPSAAALTTSEVLLGIAAVIGVAILLHRLRPDVVGGFLLLGGGAVAGVTVVAAAAAGVVAAPVPSLAAVAVAVVAAVVWLRDPARWLPVLLTEVVAVVLALVDLDLLAAVTGAVALHLLVVAGRRRSEAVAALGVGAGLAAVAATGAALDLATVTTTLVVTAVAALVLVGAQVAEVCRPWRALPTDVVLALGAATAIATAWAAAGASSSVAAQLAVVAVAAVVHAARPGRGWAVWVASLAVSGAVWTLLGDRGVDVVEAYSLPAAVALAVAGGWRLHTTDASSWTACSPASVMAALPTLAVLVDGPDPVRVLVLTAGAVAVALAGHWRRLAAPLAFGAVVAAVTALLQLYDWTAHVPRWVTFGTLGGLLIWTSATYEAQLQRAQRVRAHLADLR